MRRFAIHWDAEELEIELPAENVRMEARAGESVVLATLGLEAAEQLHAELGQALFKARRLAGG